MSGHSKWANIKHKKAAADAKRGKIFTRIAKEITIAARDGGGDPDANPRLRLAIQNARSVNMPSDNIKRAIQKGTGEIEGVNYEEARYEGYTPGGVSIIVETVTDNRNRTFSEIRTLFGKNGGSLGEQGSVAWNFERKGVILIKTDGRSEDDLLELVLESGAEDLEYDEELSRIVTGFTELASVSKYFEANNIKIEESKLEYVPKTLHKINTLEEAKKVMRFIDVIEEHDDVQNVFSNFDIPDDILEQLNK
jgi:YebC/PmpR family DNA-binding regulatory protein